MRNLIVLWALLAAGLAPAISAAGERHCDRGCLQALTEQYMRAVAADDVSAAPLMPGFRQTENTRVTREGIGVWKTVTGIDDDARFILDPVNGQALWFGIVDTVLRDRPDVAMVRVKVVDNMIAEAEWFMSGPGLGSMRGPAQPDGTNEVISDPENLAANKPPVRVVPVGNRLSRTSLTAIANSYFDGLTANDGSLVRARPDCFRLENGETVTGRPLPKGSTDGYMGNTNCTSRFKEFNISMVAQRRFFAIDEVQQVAATSAIFMRTSNSPYRRCVFIEIFYIDDENISQIYSVIYYPGPNDPVPNWPPYYGNHPLPETFGAAE